MAFKMNARSPLMKTLVGAQKNLPEGLKNAIEAAPESPAKNMNKGYGTPAPTKMNKGERYDMKMASDQNLKASARKNYAENAEAAQKSSPAKVKYDKELNTLVSLRKGLKKGTAEYNTIQNKINSKLGSKKVHGRGTGSGVGELASKSKKIDAPKPEVKAKTKTLISKESRNPVGELNLAPAPKTPKLTKSTASKPAAKKNSPRVTQTANRATVVTKSNGVKKKETVNKNTGNKKVVVKDADTRTVTNTNKAGESTTKTTKRIGKGRIKGAIKDARLARLDRVAKRQAAKAKGSGKKPGSKTEQFG
jgi:hypothetical protein